MFARLKYYVAFMRICFISMWNVKKIVEISTKPFLLKCMENYIMQRIEDTNLNRFH